MILKVLILIWYIMLEKAVMCYICVVYKFYSKFLLCTKKNNNKH